MTLHEKTKQAMVAEELVGYFLEKGILNINLSIEILKDKSLFHVTLYERYVPIIKEIKSTLYCCREKELEEYGMELFIDEEPSDVLHNLGMLIDDFTIEEFSDKVVITFIRDKI